MLVDTWNFLAKFPIVLSIVVVIVGLSLAVAAHRFILFWGSKITARTATELDEKLLSIIARAAALVVGYTALAVAVQVLGLGELTQMATLRLMLSVLILQLIKAAIQAGNLGLEIMGRVRNRFPIVEERTIPLFDLIITVVILAIGAYALLQVWNIDPAAWLASAGVLGIAVGFCSAGHTGQSFRRVFLSSPMPPIPSGIMLCSAAASVASWSTSASAPPACAPVMTWRSSFPMLKMANAKIINESGGIRDRYRLRIKVGVAYGSDLDQVCALLDQVARAQPEVIRNPAPRVRNRGFGDSSVDFELLCWIRTRPTGDGSVMSFTWPYTSCSIRKTSTFLSRSVMCGSGSSPESLFDKSV